MIVIGRDVVGKQLFTTTGTSLSTEFNTHVCVIKVRNFEETEKSGEKEETVEQFTIPLEQIYYHRSTKTSLEIVLKPVKEV